MTKWKPNEYEQTLIEEIRKAERYVSGELEVNFDEDGWYARDYKENYGGSFAIETNDYDWRPLIYLDTAERYNVDVAKCCAFCKVYYVG